MAEETISERDARLNTWLATVKVGDIVTVRLNSTDTLTGRVYEADDDSRRTALYVFNTLLRYGNGIPGGSYEPVLAPSPAVDYEEVAEAPRSAIAAALALLDVLTEEQRTANLIAACAILPGSQTVLREHVAARLGLS